MLICGIKVACFVEFRYSFLVSVLLKVHSFIARAHDREQEEVNKNLRNECDELKDERDLLMKEIQALDTGKTAELNEIRKKYKLLKEKHLKVQAVKDFISEERDKENNRWKEIEHICMEVS